MLCSALEDDVRVRICISWLRKLPSEQIKTRGILAVSFKLAANKLSLDYMQSTVFNCFVTSCNKSYLLSRAEPQSFSIQDWQKLCPHPSILIGGFKFSKQTGHSS